MLEERELIKFIAEYLEIDEKLILAEANLSALCAISLFLASRDQSSINKSRIKFNRLSEKLENPKQNGPSLIFDLTKFFDFNEDDRILLEDRIESDGFFDLQLKRDLLILEIEQLLHFPHTNEELIEMKIESVIDLINLYCKVGN